MADGTREKKLGSLRRNRLDTLADRVARAVADAGPGARLSLMCDEGGRLALEPAGARAVIESELIGTYTVDGLEAPVMARLAGSIWRDLQEHARLECIDGVRE